MSEPKVWTVYTVEQVSDFDFTIFKTIWTDAGPGERTIHRTLYGVIAVEAWAECARVQADYDRLRLAMAKAAE